MCLAYLLLPLYQRNSNFSACGLYILTGTLLFVKRLPQPGIHGRLTLPLLATHTIDRQTVPLDLPVVSQHLHDFANASSLAYGAVVYLCAVYLNSETSIVLVASKARVAPLRPITIPRLEFTAAYLLAKLLALISLDLSIPAVNVHAWTDSTITLSWIRKSPSSLKTFVVNRVAVIQDIVAPALETCVIQRESG